MIPSGQGPRLLELLAGPRKSDRAVRGELGLTQSQLVTLGASVREELGLAPGASLRAYARAWAREVARRVEGCS